MAVDPIQLFLDEPMAGMNQEEKEDMVRYVLDVNDGFGATIELIEHRMNAVARVQPDDVALINDTSGATGNPMGCC